MFNVLITGIEGFVGPYLRKLFLDSNNNVIGTFLEEPTTEDKSQVYKMDILKIKEIENIFSQFSFDYIVHLAGFSSVGKSYSHPEMCERINVDGTKNLLDTILKFRQNPRILIISSGEIYGNPEYLPIDEKHPINPVSPYGISRLKQEKICFRYIQDFNMNIIIARSFNHTGEKQPPLFAIPSFAKQIAEIEKGLLTKIKVGNLSAYRDFSDVRDVVNAYKLILEQGKIGNIYNVCQGKSYKLEFLLKLLISYTENEIDIVEEKALFRQNDIEILLGDNRKLIKELKWKIDYDFEKTLLHILNFHRKKIFQ